eukprot:CAMPEP_0181088042 /NCGR_PEP_ID=MMETSP1071-20121207/6581_1 /TAXON_ID=35127 /ORGANISM="Thalassiosira sp., Strain NH16" /LENGTH=917 /DNA_ID=CAMNT_0023169943 /DNA_START=252 /DNA_END=3005 /DNA_ORIENTATION=-
MAVEPPPGGISATVDEEDVDAAAINGGREVVTQYSSTATASTKSEAASSSTNRVGINSRGAKMNEIDFTLAPTDVSLSRCYQMSKDSGSAAPSPETAQTSQSVQSLSLTRALNTASNRAVRRILLSRSWPSAEALNLSLRTVLMQQQQKEDEANAALLEQQEEGGESDKMKCPVPRPILNVIMSRRDGPETSNSNPDPRSTSLSSEEREQQWVTNQIAVFRESYIAIPNYNQAEAYLESILSLATSGTESERVEEVMEGGVYVEPYVRILSQLQSVGAVLEEMDYDGKSTSTLPRRRIAKKLIDQDFCLSVLDKLAIASGNISEGREEKSNPLAIPYDAAARLAYDADPSNQPMSFDEFKTKYESETVAMVSAKKRHRDEAEMPSSADVTIETDEEPIGAYEQGRKRRLSFWSRDRKKIRGEPDEESEDENETTNADAPTAVISDGESSTDPIIIKPDDLGGVLLSAEEPTMTRQLNVLSNIVQRTLIFGGDQELLVLSETLDADKPAFIQRWYKNDPVENTDTQLESRPGVQFLNSLTRLLRDCYTKGVLKDVTPTLPLSTGYQNAYGRLTASLIELGSGYIRPSSSSPLALSAAAAAKYLKPTEKPNSARGELGRFIEWETAIRKNRVNPYPDDIVGTWDVEDVVGGQIIGTTEVSFKPQGELKVKPPMQGLRWRLDPGPTHLDTCTFQVLSDDGEILQYKGFVDRGSRLEARISKRSVTMRGGVSFLMRDAESSNIGTDYWDDMVPMNYKSGTTKFIMSKNINNKDDGALAITDSPSTVPQAALRCPPVSEGEREILNGPNGPILVTRVAGTCYAVDATCPHLNLPMKKGKISVENGKPSLTCSFHNSCFEMKTGKCTEWVTGALGTQNEFISGIMSNMGNSQKDIMAYQVMEEEDGSLSVTSEAPQTSKQIAA